MIILWKGWGILSILIAPVVFVVSTLVLTPFFMLLGIDSDIGLKASGTISLMLSAAAVYAVGRKLNGKPARVLRDETTGEEVVLKPRHSLFLINMEYWAIPIVIIAVIFLLTPL